MGLPEWNSGYTIKIVELVRFGELLRASGCLLGVFWIYVEDFYVCLELTCVFVNVD